jgi:hypothetical protein
MSSKKFFAYLNAANNTRHLAGKSFGNDNIKGVDGDENPITVLCLGHGGIIHWHIDWSGCRSIRPRQTAIKQRTYLNLRKI